MNEIMNNILELPSGCTGCAACALVCPQDCIKVEINQEGFYTANVDNSICLGCGVCKTVCIRAGVKNVKTLSGGEMFSAQSKSSATVQSCTSGGIAKEMADRAVFVGMSVCGVKYDYEKNRAVDVIAHNAQESDGFRGSKYLQSECLSAFREMINDAKNEEKREFLVFGTPCQIYGLSNVLEKKGIRDRFVLIDLFCHGVPSYLVWDCYLQGLSPQIGDPVNVIFRDKTIGWHNFVMHIKGTKGEYRKSSEGDLFYHCFFDNVLFSEACFDCPVRKEFSKADIRLGDFWGPRYQGREDGVSAVLCLSDRGKNFLASLDNVQIFDRTAVNEVLNGQSIHTYSTESIRKVALNELRQTKNIKKTVHNYRKNFSIKHRIKLFLKEGTSILPDSVRAQIRYKYRTK